MAEPLPADARALIESGALGHLVTVNRDDSPQVSCVWVGIDGDELVSGHLHGGQQKLRNLRRDPRVYLGPDVKFPPMDDPPPGFVLRIAVDRLGGVPWGQS